VIIDSHFHLVDKGWVHDDFFIGMAKIVVAGATKATGEQGPDPAEIVKNLMPVLADTTGEKVVAKMDAAGVDKSCIFCVDYAAITGEPGVEIEEQNRMVAEAGKRFPDRLIPFFSIDPRRDGALEMFKRGVEDWGMKGAQVPPDRRVLPVPGGVLPALRGLPRVRHAGGGPHGQPAGADEVPFRAADLPR
jgi:predicted TIM-barrel fold metal-dependent hydrolase